MTNRREARLNGWLGEVQGLQVSLNAASSKLVSLDRTRSKAVSIVDLGIPTIAAGDHGDHGLDTPSS